MRTVLKFIIRQHNVIIFLLLETLCIFLTIKYNEYHENSSFSFFKDITGHVHTAYYSIKKYIGTIEENRLLAEENSRLRTLLASAVHDSVRSTVAKYNIQYIPAKIVYATTRTANNYLIIDKGLNDSIMPDMGVISPNGVVGIVKDVSDNFSTVLPIINVNAHISARIKTNSYFGTTVWDGKNSKIINLADIPYHVKLNKGDTVITSGFSAIFPEGIEIGTIVEFDYNEGNDFYNIKVQLKTDFNNINHVYVIRNLLQKEYKQIEQTIKNDKQD